jgi:hypothetical protein
VMLPLDHPRFSFIPRADRALRSLSSSIEVDCERSALVEMNVHKDTGLTGNLYRRCVRTNSTAITSVDVNNGGEMTVGER